MRRTLMPRASPVGVGSDVGAVRDDRDHVARLLVFGCRFYLVTVESDHDRRVWLGRVEPEGAPVDGDLAATDTKESAKIDDRRARLAGFVDEQVDDAAHRLVGGAADLLAEDATKVRLRKLLQARAFGRRRLVRAIGSVVHGWCLPGRRVGRCRDRNHKCIADDLSCGKYSLSTTGGDAPKFSYAIKQPGH